MSRRRPSLCLLLLVGALASACGSADRHRAVRADDGGIDSGGGGGRGSGGRGSGGRGSGGGGIGAGGSSAGGSSAGGASPADAGDSGAPDARTERDASFDGRVDGGADARSDARESGSDGPVLGEFCNFVDPNLENAVRSALSNVNVDGGVPSGPLPVVLAARVTSLDLFCDCNDVLDFGGVECLTGLQSLVLAGQYTSLEQLAFVPSLSEIRFDYTDTLPAGLAAITQLRRLDLGNNQITDLSVIADLTSLTDLDLSNNPVSDLSPLSALVNLTTLRLYGTQIVNLAPLSSMVSLRVLVIANNRITDLGPISGLTALTRLEAGQNPFTDLSALAGLTSLAYLDVSSTAALTDFSPLVANSGLGAGDEVYATPRDTDCASFKADAQALTDRGVVLYGFPICP